MPSRTSWRPRRSGFRRERQSSLTKASPEPSSWCATLVGDHSDAVLELLDRFEKARPSESHYYLTVVGVRDHQRGRGIGMRLLANNLERSNAEGMPAYLESSNAANDHRYEALGFRRIGELKTPDDAVVIDTFWRDPA